jgi:hypothetical protein
VAEAVSRLGGSIGGTDRGHLDRLGLVSGWAFQSGSIRTRPRLHAHGLGTDKFSGRRPATTS